ncbi:glutamine synthetase [Fusarium sp. NRRL 52700]|nr:glutamine synthetase [Fusarium sp. NRRL 52700]
MVSTDLSASIGLVLSPDLEHKAQSLVGSGYVGGKIIHKSKFLFSLESGFETTLTSADSGYQDFTAVIDLDSLMRLPFEDNIALFLLRFYIRDKSVFADGRGMVKALTDNLADSGYKG